MLIKDNISLFICQTFAHNIISINENSLTWATVNPALKEVFFLYQRIHISVITIRGFPISIKKERANIGVMYPHMLVSVICVPKSTKNITMKKSRKDFIFELISNLYGDMDNVTQAINAQISIENHAKWKILANNKHRQIENNSRNSWDFATFFKSLGIM